VRFDGRGVSDRTEWARIRARRIGIVFQNFCLIPSLSARENVEIAMLGQVSHAHVRRARARMLLAEQGLAAREHLRPSELSGGERQRVAIARALANKPEMLIADEPTGSLDQRMSGVIMKVLTELERTAGLTLVVVTHDSSVAAHCARRIVLTDGRVTADSTAEPEAFRSADRMTGAANSP
jgi:ABC-type lipoprotein export system ATPase subunit